MGNQERSRSEYFGSWRSASLLKLGALSLIAGGLLEANAGVHFYENALSAQGLEALALGAVALEASASAFSEVYRRQSDIGPFEA